METLLGILSDGIPILIFAIPGLAFLVVIHELGHLLMARWSGIGVEAFSLFFGRAIFKFQWKGIEWRVGWIPFGGYCKMKGQEDFGEAKMKGEADEFYQRPAWARLLAVLGGPVFNIIFGIMLFIGITYFDKEMITPNRGIVVSPEYKKTLELKDGDVIQAVDGHKVKSWNQVNEYLFKGVHLETQHLTVKRNGQEVKVPYEFDKQKRLRRQLGFTLPQLVVVSGVGKEIPVDLREINKKKCMVMKKAPAANSEMIKGDYILAVDGQQIQSVDGLKNNISQGKNKGEREFTLLEIVLPGEIGLNSFNNDILSKLTKKETQSYILKYYQKDNKVYTLKKGLSKEERSKLSDILRSVNYQVGLLVSVDGKSVNSISDLAYLVSDSPNNSEHKIVLRARDLRSKKGFKEFSKTVKLKKVKIKPAFSKYDPQSKTMKDTMLLGINLGFQPLPGIVEKTYDKNYTFLESMNRGMDKAWGIMTLSVNQFKLLSQLPIETTRENVAGPLKILKHLAESALRSFREFINLIALLSLFLGIFNLLPIPAVDGGHVVITLYEMIRRKTLSLKVMQRIQMVGVYIIISIAILVLSNDVYNWNSSGSVIPKCVKQ